MSRYQVETESGVYEVETNSFKDWEAAPRVELKLTDELRALIHQQVAFGIAEAMRNFKPTVETKIIKETIHEPTKIIVKELIDNSAELIKEAEKRIKKALDEYEKSGRGMYPVVVPNSIADQTGNGGKILSTDGRLTKWITASSGGGGTSTDAYTTSNVTTDRSFDATSTSLDELANVLGSLIASLQGAGIIQ